MPSIVALLLCLALTLVLLRIERRRNPEASPALWLPIAWTAIIASRPIGRWFLDFAETDYAAGSPSDQVVLLTLMVLSVIVVANRRVEWRALFADNRWLLLLFLFACLSVIWSDVPFISGKRWIRAFGTLIVGLVVMSERDPLKALESVVRRIGYLLLPMSYVLIHYYPALGRTYGRWDGFEMWLGVATHKNGLGQLCAMTMIFITWSLVSEARAGNLRRLGAGAVADVAIVALCGYLLLGPGSATYSATSLSVVMLSLVLIALLQKQALQKFVLSSVTVVLLVAFYILFYDDVIALASYLLDRSTTLTGRATDIWPVVLDAAYHNPVLGAGYGGVWGLGGEVSQAVEVEQAHNGYLDLFLQLGATGIVLLAAWLLEFARNTRRLVGRAGSWPILGACMLYSLLVYNNSESTFIEYPSYIWTLSIYLPMVFAAWRRAAPIEDAPGVVARGSAAASVVVSPTRVRHTP